MNTLKIKIPIYNYTVYFTVTDNIKEAGLKFNLEYLDDIELCYGICTRNENNSTSYIFITEKKGKDWNTITHEALHAVTGILESRCIPISRNNDETMCYLLGYIIEKIQKFIEKDSK